MAPIFLGIGHNTFIESDDVIDNGLRQVRIPVGITDKRIIFKMIAFDSILSKDDSLSIKTPKNKIARQNESQIGNFTTSHSDSNKRNYHVKWLINH